MRILQVAHVRAKIATTCAERIDITGRMALLSTFPVIHEGRAYFALHDRTAGAESTFVGGYCLENVRGILVCVTYCRNQSK